MQCNKTSPNHSFLPVILWKLFANEYRNMGEKRIFKCCSHASNADQLSIWQRFQAFEPGSRQWQKDSCFYHLSVIEKAASRGNVWIQFFLSFQKPPPLILGILENHPRVKPWPSFQYQFSMWLVFFLYFFFLSQVSQ